MLSCLSWVSSGAKCPQYLFQQVRFKRSKKRKMVHRVMTEVRREATGFAPGPSLGSIIGNPESPYTVARNIKHHLARLSANDTTHIRRKKDFGRMQFHQLFSEKFTNPSDTVTGLSSLQQAASLPESSLDVRFPFPHQFSYKAQWGPPTVVNNESSEVSVSFRVADLLLRTHETQRLIDIVGDNRYDKETGVVCIVGNIFPEKNHNAAFLGDVLEQLIKLSVDEPENT